MGPVREQATALLAAEGLSPPTRTRGGGKAKRLTYRYPIDGIPGAPLRDRGERRQQLVQNPRMQELRRERAVASLRVWLAGLDTNARRSQAQYVRWQVGSGYAAASLFPRSGGFAALKQEAADDNARVRQAGGDPLADAQARVDAVAAELEAIRQAGKVRQPKPVLFGDALRAVLAGPHAEARPPKQ